MWRATAALAVSALAGLGLACGPEDAPADGGSPDAGISFTVDPPAPPENAALPVRPDAVSLEPCPPGWTVRGPRREDTATVCAPFDTDTLPACAPGTMLLPGETACAAIDACPAALEFPSDIPATGVVFVRAAAVGGDGTAARPFATIGEALAVASRGDTIAIAAGTYAEALDVAIDVSLRGACASAVHVVGGDAPALRVRADVSVSGLTLEGAGDAAFVAADASLALARAELRGGVLVGGALDVDRVHAHDGPIGSPRSARFGAVDFTPPGAPITVSGGELALSGSHLEGGEAALTVEMGGAASLTESVVARSTRLGVVANDVGATVALTDVVVLGVTNGTDEGTCVEVNDGATVEATRVLLSGCGADGLSVYGEGSLGTLRAVAVEDVGFDALARNGHAVLVTQGGHIDAYGLVVDAPRLFAVTFFLASAFLEDLFILDVTGGGSIDPEDGLGLLIGSSHVAVRRGLIRGTRVMGIGASDPEAQVHLEDVTIADTRPTGNGQRGRGLSATTGAKIEIERVLVTDAHEDGVFIANSAASVVGTDFTVLRTQVPSMSAIAGFGLGIHVQSGAIVDLRRVHVEESHGFGVLFTGDGTRGRIRDMTIARTLHLVGDPLLESFFGRGFEAQFGAEALVERLVVDGAHESGIAVTYGGRLDLVDAVVSNTEDDGYSGMQGRGIFVLGENVVNVDRARIENNRHIGVSAYGEGADVTLANVEILGTRDTRCEGEGCEPGGIGLGAYDLARIRADGFIFADNVLVGVQLAEDGEIDLTSGEIRGSPIGANVQNAGYDVSRLSRDVRYSDNGTNLDATSLPVPMPSGSIEGVGMESM